MMHSRDSRSSGVQARPANRCIRVSGTVHQSLSAVGLASGLTDLQMGYLWIPWDTYGYPELGDLFALRYDPWDDPPSNPFPLLSTSKLPCWNTGLGLDEVPFPLPWSVQTRPSWPSWPLLSESSCWAAACLKQRLTSWNETPTFVIEKRFRGPGTITFRKSVKEKAWKSHLWLDIHPPLLLWDSLASSMSSTSQPMDGPDCSINIPLHPFGFSKLTMGKCHLDYFPSKKQMKPNGHARKESKAFWILTLHIPRLIIKYIVNFVKTLSKQKNSWIWQLLPPSSANRKGLGLEEMHWVTWKQPQSL